MNPVPIAEHRLYRFSICSHVLCTSGVDMESMEDAGAQIVPVTPEVSTAYLCKECFLELPVKDVITMTQHYLQSERGLFKKCLWQWRRGASHDPFRHLEASVLFLRGQVTQPPFPSIVFTLSRPIAGNPTVTRRGPFTLLSFS